MSMLNSDPSAAEKVAKHTIWNLFSYVSMCFMVELVLLWDGGMDGCMDRFGPGKGQAALFHQVPCIFLFPSVVRCYESNSQQNLLG